MSKVPVLNVSVDNLTMGEALDAIEQLISKNENSYVFTPNVDHLVRIEKDADFREAYDNASLVLADGMPLLWMAERFGTPLKEKVSGTDLFPRLCGRAAEKGYEMFFLGAAEGVALKAAENLRAKYPGLKVTGTYSPPLGFENDEDELAKIESMLCERSPHILIVCLGTPKQEKFIYTHRERLHAAVSIGLGSCLDVESGNVKRAPAWMSNHGREWFYRLVHSPRRLFRRYIIDDIKILGVYRKYRRLRKNTPR